VAYATIEHLKLKPTDVILISSRYKVPVEGFHVYPSFQEKYSSIWQKLKTFNVPVNYDRYIDEMTGGEPFVAYVDLMSYYQRIVATHRNCTQFHFLEEGNSAYQAVDDLTDITWHERSRPYRSRGVDWKSLMRVLRGYNLRLLAMPYIYSAYVNMDNIRFYSFSKNAFYNAPEHKKVLVKPDPNQQTIADLAGNVALSNEVVWIDGSNARYTGLSEDYYYDAIQKAIDKLKEKGVIKEKVYVKLRPGIKDYTQNKLVKLLKENELEVEALPGDMILECFFMRSSNCHVIGTLTAALEYAHVFGHKAYSVYGLFEKQPPTFFDRMTGFWENIENLKT
jgi:hypothetical protein